MARAVKPTRSYDSSRRREQAAANRRRILEAAERLFAQRGYVATPMSAVATEAGVALKTVYLAFETKSGLLRALWHLRLRGDEDPAPVPQRPWYQGVVDEPDPARKLEMTAAYSRAVKERAGALMAVIRDASAADPDVAELWERIGSDFHGVMRGIVASLGDALGNELTVDRAADLLWMLNHPDVWQLLVAQRGWTPAEWEAWFLASAKETLLSAPRRHRGSAPARM